MANVALLWDVAQKGFQSEHYKLEKVVAAGMGGGIVRFVEKSSSSSGPLKRYIAKVWFAGAATQGREVQAIQDMKWSEHVVNIVSIPNNPFTDQRFVIMEYISGGTLDDFKKECNEDIPVRILWHIFLCLARACTAMAYAPEGGTNAAGVAIPVVEDVHVDWEPDHLAHRDLHTGNILFGDFDANNKEHELVPILRLIDFDRAQRITNLEDYDSDAMEDWDDELELKTKRDIGKRNPGIDHNILSIGCVMANLVGPASRRFLFADDCRKRLDDDDIHPCADLRDLIRRCLAVDPLNRPRLEVLLSLLRSYVLDIKTEKYYEGQPEGARESDAKVKDFMENYLAVSRQKQGI